MTGFDASISIAITSFMGTWPAFDKAVSTLAGFHLLKGGVMMVGFWALWFADGHAIERRRGKLLGILCGCIAAMALARLLAFVLPMRLRPMADSALNLSIPDSLRSVDLAGWSSFPSDHAALFMALSAGFFLVSRRIGLMAMAYAIVAICLPRLYLGLHYFSDLFVGGSIGVACAWASQRPAVQQRVVQALQDLQQRSPAVLYAALFLFTQQLVENFDSTRSLASAVFAWGERLGAIAVPIAGG